MRIFAAIVLAAAAMVPSASGFRRAAGVRMSASKAAGGAQSRRAALQIASGAALLGAAAPANALFGLGGSKLKAKAKEIAVAKLQVDEVERMLRTKELKGGAEDSQTVFRYSKTYFGILGAKLAEGAAVATAEEADKGALKSLADQFKEETASLEAACRSGSAEDQMKEISDMEEVLNKYLSIANVAQVTKTEAEADAFLGPFACSFWGLKRKPGSNQCVDPNE